MTPEHGLNKLKETKDTIEVQACMQREELAGRQDRVITQMLEIAANNQ